MSEVTNVVNTYLRVNSCLKNIDGTDMASEESNLKGLARFESNENNTHRDGPGFDIDWQGSVGIDPLKT